MRTTASRKMTVAALAAFVAASCIAVVASQSVANVATTTTAPKPPAPAVTVNPVTTATPTKPPAPAVTVNPVTTATPTKPPAPPVVPVTTAKPVAPPAVPVTTAKPVAPPVVPVTTAKPAAPPVVAQPTPSIASLAEEVSRLVNTVNSLKYSNDQLVKDLQSTKSMAKGLARQVSMQQLFVEERIRSDGNSGIKRSRNGRYGTRAYQFESVINGGSAISLHDHTNLDRTPGLGEFIAVMNGVEFRTRHNDYKLVMPSRTSKAYQATEPIPFPDVPPEVLAKKTIKEQIDEMREYFKAWKFQNPKMRDYTKYFKPVLCYVEGMWTQASTKIDEPFASDRHLIDASTWYDLQDKIGYTSYTGKKHIDENFAFLPTSIMDFTNDTMPVYAQWNYRILCHPLSFDVPFKALQPVDDIGTRMKLGLPYPNLPTSRAARFVIGPDGNWNGDPRYMGHNSLLDRMMREIPGLDNYGSYLTDDSQFILSKDPAKPTEPLNTAYYHRYAIMSKDAMGLSQQNKGFSDSTLYVAQTTQPKVVSKSIYTCFNRTLCKSFPQRFTYAIPLEIIYLTPLQSWNAYKLAFYTDNNIVTAFGKRTGKPTPELSFNGTTKDNYYWTPESFFFGDEIETNPADTNLGAVSVLDPTGVMRNVTASGIRALFPNIPGVGILRQRYPVFQMHEEGSYAYQQLEALKDMMMEKNKFGHLLRIPTTTITNASASVTLVMSVANVPSRHDHYVTLDAEEFAVLNAGGIVQKYSSHGSGHNHLVHIKYARINNTSNVKAYILVQCDGREPPCWDGHDAVKTGSN